MALRGSQLKRLRKSTVTRDPRKLSKTVHIAMSVGRTGWQKIDQAANYWSVVDFIDRSVGYLGQKHFYLDKGFSPAEAEFRARDDAARFSFMRSPARRAGIMARTGTILDRPRHCVHVSGMLRCMGSRRPERRATQTGL